MIGHKKFGNYPNLSISNSSGAYSGSSSSFSQPTNLSLTVTTHGYPIWLMLVDDGSGNASRVEVDSNTGNDTAYLEASFFQDSTQLNYMNPHLTAVAANNPQIGYPSSAIQYLYMPAVGTYTYTFKIRANNSGSGDSYLVYYTKLVVLELGY